MLTISRIISIDVPYFLRFYSIVVIAFACGISVCTNNGNYHIEYGIQSLLLTIYCLIQDTVNMRNLTQNVIHWNGNSDASQDITLQPELLWFDTINNT